MTSSDRLDTRRRNSIHVNQSSRLISACTLPPQTEVLTFRSCCRWLNRITSSRSSSPRTTQAGRFSERKKSWDTVSCRDDVRSGVRKQTAVKSDWRKDVRTCAGRSVMPRPRFLDMTKAVAVQVVMLSGTVSSRSVVTVSLQSQPHDSA